jgi:hypothetical protein
MDAGASGAFLAGPGVSWFVSSIMPPLYRMPVFYLAVLTLAAVIGVGSWVTAVTTIVPVPRAERSVAPDPALARSKPVSLPESAPSDGILRTAEGLRRKVVVKDLDVACQSAPDGGRSVGKPLDYFAIRFLYGEHPTDRPRMFQLGPRDGPPQGWVSTGAVLEWDTRLMVRPTPRAGRPSLVIYREERCLLDALAARLCPRHHGRCPTEGEEAPDAGSDVPKTGTLAAATALGMPILRSRSIPEPDGSTRTIFEVASLVHDQAPPPPPPEAPPADLMPALRRVYIAFVIDTTASMEATIDATRRLATTLFMQTMHRYKGIDLQLALVEYRDTAPAFGFTTRIVTPFVSPAGFRAALDRIAAAKRGDGSVDEAVFDGLAVALPAGVEEPAAARTFGHLKWPAGRAGELATKMVVLLGDAPDHARDLTRARVLAAQAKQAGITIATVALDRPGELSRDEFTRYRDQWRTLAEESFRPLDKATTFKTPVPPAVLRLEQSTALEPLLQALVDDRIAHARNLAAIAAAEAEHRLEQYVNSHGLTLDQVAPVLVDLHRGEAEPHQRPDPRAGGRKAPSLRRGWIAERIGGAPLVTVEVLLARDELGVLIDELTQLQQAAQGTAGDLADLLRIGNAAASGETAFLAADRGTQTFADHLRRRQGLPPARAESLLHRTQAELLQADELYRSALDSRLGATLAALIHRYQAEDWSDPRRTIDGMGLIPYSLIDF